MLRYALYARKSKEDRSGLIKSIQDQLEVWRSLAQERGLLIVREYEENKTAKLPGVRPVYNQMIADIKAQQIDGILVWHINRLARNMEEGGILAQMLIDGKIKEIRTPHWNYRPGDNILPLLLEQGMSTQYSLDLSEAVTRGMNSALETGGWPHPTRLGYLNARDPLNPKRGIVIKDPERFDMTRRGFDLLLTGAYSVRQVIDILNDWGLQVHPTPGRPGQPLSYALGYSMVKSPFYAGFTKQKGVVRKGTHEAMITVPEFNRLQEIMRARGKARRRRHEFAYTGLIRCGYCGLQVTGEYHFKSGKHRIYYHCSDPSNRCTKKGITEENLEREILRLLESVTVDPGLCGLALENIARWQGEQGQDNEAILEEQNERLRDNEKQRNNLLTMFLRGVITDEAMYKAKEQALLQEQNRWQMEIQKTLGDLEHIRSQARAGYAFIQNALNRFMLADSKRKKEIAVLLGIKYELKGNELSVTLNPLLGELVRFTDQIMVTLEPGVRGSESQYRACFRTKSYVGRPTQTLLEPPPSLIQALRNAHLFPAF